MLHIIVKPKLNAFTRLFCGTQQTLSQYKDKIRGVHIRVTSELSTPVLRGLLVTFTEGVPMGLSHCERILNINNPLDAGNA